MHPEHKVLFHRSDVGQTAGA